ncbi:peroxidase-like [Homarus americanus]|uniref:peroxidase-like n=1 Tax=Homarus americanus TaxID=6706 RepID=UPI001C48C43C|nr:peroxidase-like [Homarus americanus]
MKMNRRGRCRRKLCTAAVVLVFLAGISAANPPEDTEKASDTNPPEAVEEDTDINSTTSAERDRRQAYQHGQLSTVGHFGPYSGHPPTSHRRPFSVFASRPAVISQPVSSGPYGTHGSIKPSVIHAKPTVYKTSRKPTVINRTHKPVQHRRGPPRTPAHTFPFTTHAPGFTPVPARPYHTPGPIHPHYGYGPHHTSRCPGDYACMPLVTCAPCFPEVQDQPQLACSLYDGAPGVCCPGQPNRSNLRQVFTEPVIEIPRLNINFDIVDEAARYGVWQLGERELLGRELQARDIEVTNTNAPEYGHLQFFKTSPMAMSLARDALVSDGAGSHLLHKLRLTPLQAGYGLQQISISDTVIANSCPAPPRCEEKDRFYRTIDGSCNNLQNPRWGQARTTFQRLRPPQYSDGLSSPRKSVTGRELPSARLVSVSTVTDVNNPNPDLTLSLMQWGQFIDHDLTHTPIFRFTNTSGIECCAPYGRGKVDPSFTHPACHPIEIPENDPFYGRVGRRCMNFVRSMFAPRTDPCNLGFAEQMNQITHYLDGSNIYGSSEEEEGQLREFQGGLLKVQERSLLPPDFDADECESIRDGIPCFRAGDNRVNEQVQLTVIHTAWVRMHNRIARELASLNPHWSDETIYQETRRIVVAIYQHIIYNEWLPLILGKDFMAENGLLPRREGFSRDYDDGLKAAVFNEFATVAFRFGHTLVQGMLQLVGKKGKSAGTIELREQFNNPRLVYTPGKLDEFLRGLATQPVQQVDNFVSEALTNRLFETPQMPVGMDLVALNIQRGRDHAIAPYNELRTTCGLPRARTFEDLLDVIPPEVVQVFSQLYASVDDIDPFIAGISERHAPGSVLGPTFRCIIGDQFTRLKRGDRFFYDFADMPTSFTEAQLNAIRMISWARVLCESGDMIGYVQPLAFRQPRGLNQRVPCNSAAIPGLDLRPWISEA